MKYKLSLLAIVVSILSTGCSDPITQTNDDTVNFPEDMPGLVQGLHPNDPNWTDEFGNTALMSATTRCDIPAVESLLEIPGMDVHPINDRGEDVFLIAERLIRQGNEECEDVLRLLEEHHEGEQDYSHVQAYYDLRRGNQPQEQQGERGIIPPREEVIAIAPDPVDPLTSTVAQGPEVPTVQEPILPIPTGVAQGLPQRPVDIEKTDNQDTTIAIGGTDPTVVEREPGADLVPVEGVPPKSTVTPPVPPRTQVTPQEPTIDIEKTDNQDTTIAVPKITFVPPATTPERTPVPTTPPSPATTPERTPETTRTDSKDEKEPGVISVMLPSPEHFIPIPPIKLEVLDSDRRQQAVTASRPVTVTVPQTSTTPEVPATTTPATANPVIPAPTTTPLVMDSVENANITDTFGRTLLIWAAEDGKADLVKSLLESSATDVNAKDNNGETALLIATKKGNDEIVKLLLTREDIDVNAYDKMGRSPLMAAASAGYIEILYLLIVRPELDINHVLHLEKETALMQAVAKRHVAAVKILLTHENIDISIRDYLGVSPLDYADRINHKEFVAILTEHENKQD